jgi:hypothetical protein
VGAGQRVCKAPGKGQKLGLRDVDFSENEDARWGWKEEVMGEQKLDFDDIPAIAAFAQAGISVFKPRKEPEQILIESLCPYCETVGTVRVTSAQLVSLKGLTCGGCGRRFYLASNSKTITEEPVDAERH